jgi:cytochrome c553
MARPAVRTGLAMMLTAALAVVALSAAAQEAPPIVRELCVACHGIDGNGGLPLHAEYPKLAAKQAEYIRKQLRDYQSGRRKHAVMTPMAANLTPEQIDAVAAHYSAQGSKPAGATKPALLELGKRIYNDGNVDNGVPACAGCHLPDASGNSRYPHLAGQHAPYTYIELKKFASGERDNDRGLVMQSVALRLSDEEMRAVAEYLAGLK